MMVQDMMDFEDEEKRKPHPATAGGVLAAGQTARWLPLTGQRGGLLSQSTSKVAK